MRTELQRQHRSIIEALRRRVKYQPEDRRDESTRAIDVMAARFKVGRKMASDVAAWTAEGDARLAAWCKRVQGLGLVHIVEVQAPGHEEAERLYSEVEGWLEDHGDLFTDERASRPFAFGPSTCLLFGPTFRGVVGAAFAGPNLALEFKMRFG